LTEGKDVYQIKELTLFLEQYYILYHNPEYNVLKVAGSSAGRELSVDAIRKKGEAAAIRDYKGGEIILCLDKITVIKHESWYPKKPKDGFFLRKLRVKLVQNFLVKITLYMVRLVQVSEKNFLYLILITNLLK
jgi:hypothetical protein